MTGFSVGGKTGKWNMDYFRRNSRPVEEETKESKG